MSFHDVLIRASQDDLLREAAFIRPGLALVCTALAFVLYFKLISESRRGAGYRHHVH